MSASIPRCFFDCREDAGICPAAADIAAHPLADLIVVAGVAFVDEGDAGADLAGGAIAALEAVVANERGLQGMQVTIRGKTFDRSDRLAAAHDGESET